MNAILLSRIAAAVVLVAMAGHRYLTLRPPTGIEEYRAAIRAGAERVPPRIGPWVGQDVPVPPRAIKVLDPNVIVSRRYVNVENGLTVHLLFVHCSDAHDMVGHFPPRCYVADGWTHVRSRPREWPAGAGLALGGMEYTFKTADPAMPGVGGVGGEGERAVVVANVLLRPGGQVVRDMTALSKSIIGAGGQAAGAAQVQVSFDESVSEADRDRAVTELVTGFRPALDAVLANLPR